MNEEAISLAAITNRCKGGIGEGWARIHSSDSAEGSEEGKPQRWLTAKELTSEDEAEPSGKRKAEDDNKANKKHKKYEIGDEEEEDYDWSAICENMLYILLYSMFYKYYVHMSYFDRNGKYYMISPIHRT